MQQIFFNNRIERADKIAVLKADAAYEVNVALVYQDDATRQWAGQVPDRVAELAGAEAMHCTEWKINDLKEPSVFSRGAAALARADVIVISVYAAERLPSVFYLWVNLWLQMRAGLSGALAALVVPTGESESGAMETRRYLCAVASQGGLEWLECKRPSAPIRGLGEEVFQWPKAGPVASSPAWPGGHRLAA